MKSIRHFFDARTVHLFENDELPSGHKFSEDLLKRYSTTFMGKPVEMELSHDGRYLWVPYYRRSYDASAVGPSAVAIIDTRSDEIIRVMSAGPIPKFVTVSPDGRRVAITNWGDNSITLINTESDHPNNYYVTETLVVEDVLDQSNLENTNRDQTCGFCLRGTVFTPDSRYLLVARMGGGGIAGFDLNHQTYLGTLLGMPATPRHLLIHPITDELIMSSNVSGTVSRADLNQVVLELSKAHGRRIHTKIWDSIDLGTGARTISISPDGQFIFAAMNNDKEVVQLSYSDWRVKARSKAVPYPVGLAVSPTHPIVVITSQGKNGNGGNAISFFGYQNSVVIGAQN
jgi:DNA-binding beta-propeller fold protein YncE